MNRLEDLQNKLAKYGQSHLLTFINELKPCEQDFIEELLKIDFKDVDQILQRALNSISVDSQKLDSRMQPIPPDLFESEVHCRQYNLDLYNAYYKRGLEEISKNNVGVLLMAGGQGTRLGVTYPKGMYSIGLLSGKTLFQIQAERIKRIEQLAQDQTGISGKITWYIMTSGPTFESTKKFLQENKFFGIDSENIMIFQQGLLPCFDFDGKIFLKDKNKISAAPDGNGGVYRALKRCGILHDMENRGIKCVHVHSIDNILVKVADPAFIGYCTIKKADCGVKVVRKTCPTEAVGVVCQVDGKFHVVEYSEITEETANLRDPDGNLVFSAGNICNHFFTTNFLCIIANKYETELKLHVAKKKVPHINSKGETVQPKEPNGIKIEKFVFDAFQFSSKFVIWEVPRYTDFSAVKNADEAGNDCPSTAKKDIFYLHKKYIESAGGYVIGDEVEISPLLSYAGEGLELIVKGKTFEAPIHLSSSL